MDALGNGRGRGLTGFEDGLGPRYILTPPRKEIYLTHQTGLTTWDTANVYSNGRNEEVVGKAIKKFNIPREKLNILAKIMGTVPEPKDDKVFNWMYESQMSKSMDYVNQGGM